MDIAYTTKSEQALDDLGAYLASSDEEDDDDEDQNEPEDSKLENKTVSDKIQKYKNLLKSIEEEEEENEVPQMEITFDQKDEDGDDGEPLISDDEEDDSEMSGGDEEGGHDLGCSESEKSLKDVSHEKKVTVPVKKNGRKRGNVKNKERQDAGKKDDTLDLLLMDGKEDGKSHFNYNDYLIGKDKKSKKGKKGRKDADEEAEDNFALDVDDPRFSKIYSSALYNIDPSEPHFKKTKAMESLIDKKITKSVPRGLRASKVDGNSDQVQDAPQEVSSKRKLSQEISTLVESVKQKSRNLNGSTRNRANK